MSRRPVLVTWRPPAFAFALRAQATLIEVVEDLGLRTSLDTVDVLVRPFPGGDDGAITWVGRRRMRVELALDVGNFLTRQGRRALHDRARLPRAAGRAAVDLGALPAARFSRRALAATLYHEFAHVADDLAYGIHSAAVPPARRAAFNEAWNVWIDGRLARSGVPGIQRAERWALFRHTFAARGLRRRRQRAIFDRLWHSERMSRAELLDVAQRLDARVWGAGQPAQRVSD
jgi:hypothetical protein